MIGVYLTQITTWRQRTGQDAYAKPVFAADRSILSRWEAKRAMVRDARGDEVVSEGRVYVKDPVKAGDQLVDPEGRTWTVITVWVRRGLSGSEQFREVAV